MDNEPIIRVTGLKKSFGNLIVLDNVNTEIHKGECVAIIGSSGTGKSVFLSCLNGLHPIDEGHVFVKGVDITNPKNDINAVRRNMGMVYQDFNLFTHLTVLENMMLAPMKVLQLSASEAKSEAMSLLETVGLSGKVNAYPRELSGGQQQRVAIARAMAMKPEIVLFDEPTSALDPLMVGEVLAVIRAFAKQGITMLIVTHEMEFAQEVASRIFYIDEHGIYEEGAPHKLFTAPVKEKTIAFIEKLKKFCWEIESDAFDFPGMFSQLEVFCMKYRIGTRMVYSINLCIEEYVMYILHNKIAREISLMVSYSDKTKQAQIELTYPGESNDSFLTDTEDLGLLSVSSRILDLSYTYTDCNHLCIKL